MKIKDKLIHLLGGFTNDDWHVLATSNVKPVYVQRSVRTIRAAYSVRDELHQAPDDGVRIELMAQLANKILEDQLVVFRTAPRYPGESEYPRDTYATIRVEEPTDEVEAYGMQ